MIRHSLYTQNYRSSSSSVALDSARSSSPRCTSESRASSSCRRRPLSQIHEPALHQRSNPSNRENHQTYRCHQDHHNKDDNDPGIPSLQITVVHGHIPPDQCLHEIWLLRLIWKEPLADEVLELGTRGSILEISSPKYGTVFCRGSVSAYFLSPQAPLK